MGTLHVCALCMMLALLCSMHHCTRACAVLSARKICRLFQDVKCGRVAPQPPRQYSTG